MSFFILRSFVVDAGVPALFKIRDAIFARGKLHNIDHYRQVVILALFAGFVQNGEPKMQVVKARLARMLPAMRVVYS